MLFRSWVADFLERYPQAYRLELECFARAVRDDEEPAVTGEDGIAALVLADACRRSHEEGRPVRVGGSVEEGGRAPDAMSTR